MAKRRRLKLAELKNELRRRMHHPVPEVGRWLKSVLIGYYQYYAVPDSIHWLSTMRYQVSRLWFRTLKRRSHKSRLTWARMTRLTDGFPGLESCIHTRISACALRPEVGARCGSAARRVMERSP
jgi:hypothetical protein